MNERLDLTELCRVHGVSRQRAARAIRYVRTAWRRPVVGGHAVDRRRRLEAAPSSVRAST